MRLRSSPFPVVAAPFGLTLGGGCEFSMHSDHVQVHAELYMGLVEVGVGIIPAGGGTKELLFRFTNAFTPYAEADPFDGVKRAFQLIAMGTMSTSALEAKSLGYLRESDRITMNRDRLLTDAIARVKKIDAKAFRPLKQQAQFLVEHEHGDAFAPFDCSLDEGEKKQALAGPGRSQDEDARTALDAAAEQRIQFRQIRRQ